MVKIRSICPNTGEPVAIGETGDGHAFRSTRKAGGTFGPCPRCGEMHVWRKRDADLEGAAVAARAAGG
jgi:endogenous inhibitor of DNA gyrase (YacG/DUF329 family)